MHRQMHPWTDCTNYYVLQRIVKIIQTQLYGSIVKFNRVYFELHRWQELKTNLAEQVDVEESSYEKFFRPEDAEQYFKNLESSKTANMLTFDMQTSRNNLSCLYFT